LRSMPAVTKSTPSSPGPRSHLESSMLHINAETRVLDWALPLTPIRVLLRDLSQVDALALS
jgi:hypothetical protein